MTAFLTKIVEIGENPELEELTNLGMNGFMLTFKMSWKVSIE